MKKLFIISALLLTGIATTYAAHVYTAKLFITLGTSTLKIRECADFSNAFDNGFDVTNVNTTGVNVYAVLPEGKRWSQWGTNDVEGAVIGFTPEATSVSFNFTTVEGPQLYLVDANDGSRTPIVAGTPYNFTVAAGEVGTQINNRFSISKLASIGAEICHRYGKLQVSGSYGMTVKVLNMDGSATSIADTNITTDATVEIDLAGLAAGQYKVEWNSQTLIIDVQ